MKTYVAKGQGFIKHEKDQRVFEDHLKSSKTFNRLEIHKKMDICILQKERSGVVSAILVGSDGSCNHRVAFWKNWLFDSNLSNAVPLTQDHLNWCVDSNISGIICVGLKDAYELVSECRTSGRRRRRQQHSKI